MKRICILHVILFMYLFLFAQNQETLVVFPHTYAGYSDIPVKVTYTISNSNEKMIYDPGDEVIIDCIFEYIPEDKYKGFDPKSIYLVDFQRTLYEYNYQKKKFPSDKNNDITIFGEEAFILTYENRVHKMKIRINFNTRTFTDLFMKYELDRYNVNEIDMAISRTKKIPDGVRRIMPERVYGLWGKNRISNEKRKKFIEEERVNELKKQKAQNLEKNSAIPPIE